MELLRNATTGTVVAWRVEHLTGFFQRAIGLLARSTVSPEEGVWLDACNAIHTIGMRAPIDVIFLDRAGRALQIERDVRPNRLALHCPEAHAVVELGGGALGVNHVDLGDLLELISKV